LEWPGGIQVKVLERVEIEYARDDGENILPETFIERERLLASYCVCGIDKL
jgi:hypothetical protein